MNNFFYQLKQRLNRRDALTILLLINVAIFLLFAILKVFVNIAHGSEFSLSLTSFFVDIFSFNTDPQFFLTHPWTIVTSIFTHFTLMHILFNMLVFFFAAEMFVYFFGSRKLIWIYLLGGVFGNLIEFLINLLFFQEHSITIVGASGSVMAVFMAIAIFKPDLKVKLFGVFDTKIIFIAAFYFILDFVNLGANDGVAHFAHLGGAFVGFLAVRHKESPKNILNKMDSLWIRLTSRKSKMKPIHHSRPISDDEYNARKKVNQERVDAILDKISKYGYEGLTAEEKAFLFDQSHKR